MRLTAIGTSVPRWSSGRSVGPDAGDAPLLPSRALVPIARAEHTGAAQRGPRETIATGDRSERSVEPAARAHAGFLAHLIAVSADLPQTRRRRRAEPGAAAASYAAAEARSSLDPSGRLCMRAL